jgi:hypothetical protein
LAALCLASCGGGGGGGSPPAPGFTTSSANLPAAAVVKQGRFIDSAVIGVYYETATHKGFTGMSGEFSYVEGESVTFSIGKVVFPTVPASALVTPLTLNMTPLNKNGMMSSPLTWSTPTSMGWSKSLN